MTTNTGAVKHDSGAHIALLIMKMLRRPVRIDEFTGISEKKLAKNLRVQCLDKLTSAGYATRTSEDPLTFQITRAGLAKIVELADTRRNKP